VAETATPAVSPDAAPDAQVVEEQPKAAPEAATTQIITEAVETTDKPSLAPTSSARPRTRPPARTVEAPVSETPPPVAENATAPDEPPVDPVAEALAAAVAEADPAPAGETEAETPAGPPITEGEKDALRVAVQACWNVGSLSSDALKTTVTVGMTMAQNGIPDAASIRMIGFDGGTDAAARQAYEAARRAIPKLLRHDLEARLDSALVHAVTMNHLLRQALAKVSEMELRELVGQPPAERHQQWARDLLVGLGVKG
jgi:hypothetical protein